MIGTSINISKQRLELLRNASDILGISESDLLSFLLRKSRKLFGKNAIIGRTVQYQRGDSGTFTIHHISISETDYELVTSRRYLFKISVSLIFAMSISCFLDEIIDEWTHKRTEATNQWEKYKTNIYYNNFSIDHFDSISYEIWHIPWPKE